MTGSFLTSASAFLQVVFIDLVLAGDNIVVIGIAAAGLTGPQRRKAIIIGIAAATGLRISFAAVATYLMAIVGLLLAGGLLLLWVCWKMWRELRQSGHVSNGDPCAHPDSDALARPQKSLGQAVWQIVLADVSMSLDNVLAVAGAAREHPIVLVFGLMLSVVLMGVAASFVADLLNRYRWIAYAGLAIIVFVALNMIYQGAMEARPAIGFLDF